jgi:hypothetical protein
MGMHEHRSRRGVWAHEDHASMPNGHGHGGAKYVGPVVEENEVEDNTTEEVVEAPEVGRDIILTLAIKCRDDEDASDMVYLLFGPYDDAKYFGEAVSQHQYMLTREG